jgi:hypothetical protein
MAAAPKVLNEEEIQPIQKPRGEAGDKKRGFNLQEAMGLSKEDVLYKTILVCPSHGASLLEPCYCFRTRLLISIYSQATTHRNIIAARLQPGVRFNKHKSEKLAQVYKLVSNLTTSFIIHPYMHSDSEGDQVPPS